MITFNIRKIPDMYVAAIQVQSLTPEKDTLIQIMNFVKNHEFINLVTSCHFGFTVPNINMDRGIFGCEKWISIPNEMEILPPFKKKHFAGGAYATKIIRSGEYDKWCNLIDDVQKSAYEIDMNFDIYNGARLEQYNFITSPNFKQMEEESFIQLLIRIKGENIDEPK